MEEITKKEDAAKNQSALPASPTELPGKRSQAKPTNCAKCNKALKKKIWYYRDGKYYCGKRCWRLSLKVQEPSKPA